MSTQTQKKRQTDGERIALRKKQRLLAEEVIEKKDDLSKVSSSAADDLLHRGKKLFDKVGATREACVDSDLFKNLSGFTVKQAFEIGKDASKIDQKLFLAKLREQRVDLNHGGIDWEGLGKDVSVFFSSVTPLSFMLGPLEIKKKVKTKKVRHKEEIHAESKPLQIIHKEGKTKKTEHQMFQQFLRNKLESTCGKSEDMTKKNNNKCTDFFKFLFNPDSFTQTVENIFEYSFLVKDGWVGVGLDKNDLPALFPVENQKDGTPNKDKQSVITMKMADWEAWKEIYDMDETGGVLPLRKDKEYDESRANNDSDFEEVDGDSEEEEKDEEEDEEEAEW